MFKKIASGIISATLLVASMTNVSPASASPAVPTVSYTFEGNLTDAWSGSTFTAAPACPADPCNSTTGFGTAGGDGYWEWASRDARGGGFTLDTNQTLTNTYTILMKFSFTDYSGYRKIIDYLNRTDDTGFYIYSSKINFYPLGTSTSSFVAGDPLTLMVTRQATTGNQGVFTVYTYDGTNFTEQLQVTDTAGSSIPALSTLHSGGTKLGFFYDDLWTSSEATTSGRIYSLKLWQGIALASTDLQTVATAPAASNGDAAPTPTPTPTPTQETTPNPTVTTAPVATPVATLANTGGILEPALWGGFGLLIAGLVLALSKTTQKRRFK